MLDRLQRAWPTTILRERQYSSRSYPLGHCYSAVAPFAPAPPFRLYQQGAEPRDVASSEAFTEAARKGMSEFVMLTPVKARPILVITGVLAEHDEVLALRLRRLEKLASDSTRETVRAGKDQGLFYLRSEAFPGLPVENAAIVTSLLRLPIGALDRRTSLGALNENELRVLHERVARAHELRLDARSLSEFVGYSTPLADNRNAGRPPDGQRPFAPRTTGLGSCPRPREAAVSPRLPWRRLSGSLYPPRATALVSCRSGTPSRV